MCIFEGENQTVYAFRRAPSQYIKKIIPSLRLLIVTIVFGHDCAAVQLPYFASGTLKSGKHCGSVALCLFSACCVSLRV